MNLQHVVEQATGAMPQYLEDLKTIVNIDSGTYTKVGVDRVSAYLQERFSAFGFATRFDAQERFGNHLIATRTGTAPDGPRILLIGHIDTVFSEGEAERRPFTITSKDGKQIATGPGVLDMKSCVLLGMYSLHLLIADHEENYQSVTFLCNSDEEVGSPSSKALVQELAKQADAVIVLEPGRNIDTIVSSRRGSGQYRVEVRGVKAHAGVEPQRGRNAILELAYQVQEMQALNGTVSGTTLSVGVIHGGERTNVVPDYAYCEMDVRVSDPAGLKKLEEAMRHVTSQHVLDGTTITLSGGMSCMPFERSPRNAQLLQLVKDAGKELGLHITDVSTGGASDANNATVVGTPTIDGLGTGGGLAHNPDEFIELDYLPIRIALLSGLVHGIGNHYEKGQKL